MLWWTVNPDAISAHDVSIKILHRFCAEHSCPHHIFFKRRAVRRLAFGFSGPPCLPLGGQQCQRRFCERPLTWRHGRLQDLKLRGSYIGSGYLCVVSSYNRAWVHFPAMKLWHLLKEDFTKHRIPASTSLELPWSLDDAAAGGRDERSRVFWGESVQLVVELVTACPCPHPVQSEV